MAAINDTVAGHYQKYECSKWQLWRCGMPLHGVTCWIVVMDFWRDGLLSEPPRFGEVSFSVSTQCVRSCHSGCATNVPWSLGATQIAAPFVAGMFFSPSVGALWIEAVKQNLSTDVPKHSWGVAVSWEHNGTHQISSHINYVHPARLFSHVFLCIDRDAALEVGLSGSWTQIPAPMALCKSIPPW